MGLFDVLGGARRSGGMSPMTMALLGLLAYRTVKGKGRLADLLGSTGTLGGTAGRGALGALAGPLGGGALVTGLQDLLARFRQSGQEDKVQSWVATGPNRLLATSELETALGEERVQWLMEQTGLPKEELLAGLSQELPEAVDRLTPQGRLPTDEELEP